MTAALLAGIGVFELFRMKGLAVLSFEGVLSILGAVILVLPKDPWFAFLPANTDKSALFYLIVLLLLGSLSFPKICTPLMKQVSPF